MSRQPSSHYLVFFCTTTSKTNESSQGKKAFPKQFPILNRFIHRGVDCAAVVRGRAEFEPGKLRSRSILQGHASSPILCYQNCTKQKAPSSSLSTKTTSNPKQSGGVKSISDRTNVIFSTKFN